MLLIFTITNASYLSYCHYFCSFISTPLLYLLLLLRLFNALRDLSLFFFSLAFINHYFILFNFFFYILFIFNGFIDLICNHLIL